MNAFDVPFAQISLVDRDWVHAPGSTVQSPNGEAMMAGVPRDQSLCAWVVAEGKPFVVEDLTRDPRFARNPALRAHNLHFYAGVPLTNKQGEHLGSFALFDTQTREIAESELDLLADMAARLVKKLTSGDHKGGDRNADPSIKPPANKN